MSQETSMQKREPDVSQPERMRGGMAYVPNVDILEKDNEIVLLADMPGVAPDSVDIHYEHGKLSLHGRVTQRQQEDETNFLLREYGVGDFYRRFEIGDGIDANKIEAELNGGVLTVHLPKAQQVLPRKIAVKSA